jgi:hypothetical protein
LLSFKKFKLYNQFGNVITTLGLYCENISSSFRNVIDSQPSKYFITYEIYDLLIDDDDDLDDSSDQSNNDSKNNAHVENDKPDE